MEVIVGRAQVDRLRFEAVDPNPKSHRLGRSDGRKNCDTVGIRARFGRIRVCLNRDIDVWNWTAVRSRYRHSYTRGFGSAASKQPKRALGVALGAVQNHDAALLLPFSLCPIVG